ncbi:hypothetical protein [Albidovulum sp.]
MTWRPPASLARQLPRALLCLAIALSALALAGHAPARAQEAAPDAAPAAPIASETAPADDLRIARRLRGILEELGGFERVRVRVADGVVHLTGEVADSAAQGRLDAIA